METKKLITEELIDKSLEEKGIEYDVNKEKALEKIQR